MPAVCPTCDLSVDSTEPSVTFCRRTYHNDCFNCAKCATSLLSGVGSDGGHFQHGGKVFCPICYESDFAKRCDVCSLPFKPREKWIVANGKSMHAHCFTCACGCGRPLAGTKHFLEQGLAYSEPCHLERFAPKCDDCGLPIVGAFTKLKGGKKVHNECYKCSVCASPFGPGQGHFESDGKLLCSKHYKSLNGKACVVCGTRMLTWHEGPQGEIFCTKHASAQSRAKAEALGTLPPPSPEDAAATKVQALARGKSGKIKFDATKQAASNGKVIPPVSADEVAAIRKRMGERYGDEVREMTIPAEEAVAAAAEEPSDGFESQLADLLASGLITQSEYESKLLGSGPHDHSSAADDTGMPLPPPPSTGGGSSSWEVRALTAESEIMSAIAAGKAAEARAAAAEAELFKARARISDLERQLRSQLAPSSSRGASRPNMVFH